MTDLYVRSLELPAKQIDGGIYNAGYENHQVMEIAEMVRSVVGSSVDIAVEPTDDLRSYHISSQRISERLGFSPRHTIREAIIDLLSAFEAGLVPDAMLADKYYNIKTMQSVALK